MRPRVRRTLLCHTNFRPSITPDSTPSRCSVRSGRPAPGSRSRAIVRIEQPNAPAVTHMVLIPPDGGDQQAADPGPGDVGEVEHRLVHAVGLVQRPADPTGRLGQHGLPRRHPARIEERPRGCQPGQYQGVQRTQAAARIRIAATEVADIRSARMAAASPQESTAVPATGWRTAGAASPLRPPPRRRWRYRCAAAPATGKTTIEIPLAAADRNADVRISSAGPRDVVIAGSIDSMTFDPHRCSHPRTGAQFASPVPPGTGTAWRSGHRRNIDRPGR